MNTTTKRIATAGYGVLAGIVMALSLPVYGAAADARAKPLTIIVPFPPGGSTDIQARLVAKGLGERQGRAVIVDNRPGAGGSIGAKVAASAAPDGNTVLFASTSSLVSEPVLRAKDNIDVLRDFAPVTQLTDMPFLFVVAASSRFKSLSEFVTQVRGRPGDATYASWGKGSVGHIIGEMFKLATKTEGLHVPYKGEAQGITDVVGGQVLMMFVTAVNTPHVQAGRLRALAVTGEKRMHVLPNVPTFIELGYKGIDLPMWFGLVIPAKTPAEVIPRLHADVTQVLAMPEFTRAVAPMGVSVVGNSPAEFGQRIRTDAALVANLAKVANLKLDD
ncbi:MAG: tripartite tricarboxylate transporter substrate binding protein [Burkholderiales bacterium]|nr:tripartite tricarboxylate transporter substrate binding protein [Burkholderiales bacterium]